MQSYWLNLHNFEKNLNYNKLIKVRKFYMPEITLFGVTHHLQASDNAEESKLNAAIELIEDVATQYAMKGALTKDRLYLGMLVNISLKFIELKSNYSDADNLIQKMHLLELCDKIETSLAKCKNEL